LSIFANSLDAEANRIIVKVKEGGKSLIQVQDNGKGIHVSGRIIKALG